MSARAWASWSPKLRPRTCTSTPPTVGSGRDPSWADAPAVPLRQTDGYHADAIGLRTLDESGRLRLLSYEGEHMRFSNAYWQSTILPILKD